MSSTQSKPYLSTDGLLCLRFLDFFHFQESFSLQEFLHLSVARNLNSQILHSFFR